MHCVCVCAVVCWCAQVSLAVLHNDNQANGVISMRLFLDLNKYLVRNHGEHSEQYFNEAVSFMQKVGPWVAEISKGLDTLQCVSPGGQRQPMTLMQYVAGVGGVFCGGFGPILWHQT